MRSFTFCVLTAITLTGVTTSQAADLDYGVLRGPEDESYAPAVDWSGGYIGAHGGYTSSAFGFNSTSRDIIANALRQTTIESELQVSSLLMQPDVRKGGASFGGYAGYNMQFEDVVLGIEVDYTSLNVKGVTSDSIGRQAATSDGFYNFYNVSGRSSTSIKDYGTIRARAGYALGSFLPFVTGGLAIGRAHISDAVSIQARGYDQTTYNANRAITDGSKPAAVNNYGYTYFDDADVSNSIIAPADSYGRSKTKVVGGITAGAGMEFAVTSSFLLRAEYQYVLFNDFDGHKANLNTVRAGAAVKF